LDAAIEELPEKNVVSTTKIAPAKSGVGPSEKATEITSWHWHEGGKIAKRSAAGIHYYAFRAKSRDTKNWVETLDWGARHRIEARAINPNFVLPLSIKF
jgi:hypothetical protein